MFLRKKNLIAPIAAIMIFAFAAMPAQANDKGYDAVVRHLKTKYKAKKVNIPFMFLARAAIKMARPAGVKSFNLTIFEKLNFSPVTLDAEMQSAMRNSLSADWSSIIRVRSRNAAQVYMYMRESGKDLKIMLVTIDKENATIIRATFSPDKLAEFMDNPRIFGISLDAGKTQPSDDKQTSKENKSAPE